MLNGILGKKVAVTSFGEKTEVRWKSCTVAARQHPACYVSFSQLQVPEQVHELPLFDHTPDLAADHCIALPLLSSCAVLQQPNPGPNPVGPSQLSAQPSAAASSSSLSIVFQCR